MYFKITKSFLQSFSKEHIVSTFALSPSPKKKPKYRLIDEIIEKYSSDKKGNSLTPWFSVCPFCRREGKLFASRTDAEKPIYCVFCGKTTPVHSFEKNLQNTDALLILASKMNLKSERNVKSVLTEQGLITIITSLEVLMRQTYSLIYDLQHVVFGKSLFSEIYPRTRSAFLNLGSAITQIRKLTSFDLKKEIAEARYKFLSHMYSTRHIIIHNSSLKDKEFINQTNSTQGDLGKSLKLTIPEVRRAKSIATVISKKLDLKLRETILGYQKQKTSIEIKLRK